MQYPVELNIQYPAKLSRLSTFFRFILIIPHYIILYFLAIAAGVVMILSWFAILFTGRYPRSFFDFMAWFMRWYTRFEVYSCLMTDKYPPFSGENSTIETAPVNPTDILTNPSEVKT